MKNDLILAIDQGTTSTRAILYDGSGRKRGQAAQTFPQIFPQPGWVEHDPREIWKTVGEVVAGALADGGESATKIAAIGVTNQRETVVLWDRRTGEPAANAIVWQDRRTADYCRQHHSNEPKLFERTGLVLDPYFSATKIHWLLGQDETIRRRADNGELIAGTIDSWILWNLTGGQSFATDETNASRTLLMNIHRRQWDEELLQMFDVPRDMLPQILPSMAEFGKTKGLSFLADGIPITAMVGDQQSALVGQGGFSAGDAKCTYGTGAFFLQHTGGKCVQSTKRLLTSLAASVTGEAQYVLEGSVFVAGSAVQWLRDGLELFAEASDVEDLAVHSDAKQPVLFVPALAGLGAPFWVPDARGVILGLSRSTTKADIARATLEGVALRITDLVDVAEHDTQVPVSALRVDGGMARNEWFVQRQADLLGKPVVQSTHPESTALGAAFLAGMKIGVWPTVEDLKKLLAGGKRFEPLFSEETRNQRRDEWRRAVQFVMDYYDKS